MKVVLLLLCLGFAGCGDKSNEDRAKDLIKENLKSTLPDYENYSSVNFGNLGTASLPYEETGQFITNLKALNQCKDSITLLTKMIGENKTKSPNEEVHKERLQQLLDNSKIISERNNTQKQAYIPEKLFRISHAYTIKDKSGLVKKTEDVFYIDKDLKRVVKVNKVY